MLGLLLLACRRYADRAGLLRENRDPDMRRSTSRRIVVAQVLHSGGLLIGLVDTYVGIGFIVLLHRPEDPPTRSVLSYIRCGVARVFLGSAT